MTICHRFISVGGQIVPPPHLDYVWWEASLEWFLYDEGVLKRVLTILVCSIFAVSMMAKKVKMDKERCVVIKDGKEYPLYGKVKIKLVDNFEGVKR